MAWHRGSFGVRSGVDKGEKREWMHPELKEKKTKRKKRCSVMMLVFVLALMKKKKLSSNRSVNICKNDRLTTGAESIRPQVQNLTADKRNHRSKTR